MRRKLVLGALVALMIAGAGVSALAEDVDVSLDGEARIRYERFENYTDQDDDADDAFDLWPYRAMIGAEANVSDTVSGRVDLQAYGFFGDPTTGLQTYIVPSGGQVNLYQAYGKVKFDGWSIQAGRFEHTLGNELHIGNSDFYNGQVYDGVLARGEYDRFAINAYWHQLVETGSPTSDADNDAWFLGADVNIPIGGSYIEPYLLYLNDRDGLSSPGSTASGAQLYTLGALWQNEGEDSPWDASAEFALQTGDVATGTTSEIDAEGMILEGWFGWTFADKHRVHGGLFWTTGDEDIADDKIEAFIPLFTDEFAHNRLGDLDIFSGELGFAFPGSISATGNGVTDINVGYTYDNADTPHEFRASVHSLTLTEDAGVADDSIGEELDVAYTYQQNEMAAFEVGLANLFVGDAWGTDADDISRVWGQVRVVFGK